MLNFSDELDHVLNLTKPKIIISSKYGAQNIANVASKSKFLQHLIVFDGLSNKIQSKGNINILDYNEVINRKSVSFWFSYAMKIIQVYKTKKNFFF